MADEPLDPTYVEEVPEEGEFARQPGKWVPSYPKDKLDLFVEEVTSQAQASSTSATKAVQAAAAANRDANRCSGLVEEAKQQVGLAQGEVQQAQSARGAAELQAIESKKQAGLSAVSAGKSEASYLKAKALVDGFDPYRNQYGYSPVVMVNTDTYHVTRADVGRTLVFPKTSRLVLPSSNVGDFEEHFFFHALVLNEEDQLFIDHDIRTRLRYNRECSPIISSLKRGTMQLLAADDWMLFDLTLERSPDFILMSDENAQQTHGNYSKQVDMGGAWVYSLSKRYGQFRGAIQDVASGKVTTVNHLVGQGVDLPDGDIQVGYSSKIDFTGRVAVGVFGKHNTLGQQLGWFWGDSGLRGNLFPFQIDGYSGADWFLTDVSGDFKSASKTIWVQLEHRILKNPDSTPRTVSLTLTSTNGFSWVQNRYSKLNTRLAAGEIVLANFPELVLERGHLYTRLKTGEIKRTVYDLTKDTFVVEAVADGFTKLVDLRYYGGPSYSLIFLDDDYLHLLAHDWTQPKVANALIENVVEAAGMHGDLARKARCIFTTREELDGTVTRECRVAELVPRVDWEDGWLNVDPIPFYGVPDALHFGGQFVNAVSDVNFYYLVEYHTEQADGTEPGLFLFLKNDNFGGYTGFKVQWFKSHPLFVGRYLKGEYEQPAVFTGVGIFHLEFQQHQGG